MKLLIGLAFGLALAAQPFGGPSRRDSRGAYGYSGNSFAERISLGERMGLLTRREASKLWDMERTLRREMERSYRSGFSLSGRERDRLSRMTAQLNFEISRHLRNGESYRGVPFRR